MRTHPRLLAVVLVSSVLPLSLPPVAQAAGSETQPSALTASSSLTRASGPSGATLARTGAADGDFVLAPTSGPAGSTLTATDSGPECDSGNAVDPDRSATIQLFGPGGKSIALEGAEVSPDGSFALSARVPPGTTPGTYDVVVVCLGYPQGRGNPPFYYRFKTRKFTVVATTGRPGSAPQPATKPAVPRARPATAVAGQPQFTG